MRRIAIVALIGLLLFISGCTKYQTVPEEYVDHECAKYCYVTSSQGMDQTFVKQGMQHKSLLSQIVRPVCRDYSDEYLQELEEMNIQPGSLIPFSPACEGPKTLCDCELENGEFVSDYLEVESGHLLAEVIKQK